MGLGTELSVKSACLAMHNASGSISNKERGKERAGKRREAENPKRDEGGVQESEHLPGIYESPSWIYREHKTSTKS